MADRIAADRIRELEAQLASATAERGAFAAELARVKHYVCAVERSPLGIMCVSAVTGRYVFLNEAYANFVGHARSDLLTRDPYQVWVAATHPDDIEAERGAIASIAKGEIDHHQFERRMISQCGETRWVSTDLIGSRDANGRLEYLTVFLTDIQQQRAAVLARDHLENQLQQAQKLGAIGKLAGGIAHDFNNRLVIIMGYAELLKTALPPQSPLGHHTDMILESARGAADLTRQLLAYGRRQFLKPEAFDLNAMVDRMHRLLKSVIGDHIELVALLGAKSPIRADPGQIEQVILNLALNARDAMPEGGKLTLETREVAVPVDHRRETVSDLVALVVSDTGTGISEDVLPHIFEPFFTTKELGQGTGLGLAMVEGIVHQSGGSTHVESTLGAGTTFTIHLPCAQDVAAPARNVSERLRPVSIKFETVLVCDDDEDVRTLLIAVLRLRGYSILEARNGRHALEVAGAHTGPIDLLVTDLAMPEFGGVQLGADLRRRRPDIKILYISGHAEDGDALAMSLGPEARFLPKPFLPADLTQTVSAILEGSGLNTLRK